MTPAPTIVNYSQLSSTIVKYRQLSPTIVNYRQLLCIFASLGDVPRQPSCICVTCVNSLHINYRQRTHLCITWWTLRQLSCLCKSFTTVNLLSESLSLSIGDWGLPKMLLSWVFFKSDNLPHITRTTDGSCFLCTFHLVCLKRCNDISQHRPIWVSAGQWVNKSVSQG